MFTGIVTDVGTVADLRPTEGGCRLRVATSYDPDTIAIGASIACAGICLTVVAKGRDATGWFEAEASTETLQRTTLGTWAAGTRINLERALRAGDELGGHIVSGHVDGVARVLEREPMGDAVRFSLEVPESLSRFVAGKGSVTLDGTSLTVNDVVHNTFTVMIIPHTLAATTWGDRHAGDRVNLEVDVFARYLDRLVAKA
ncbi:riboflavin synthase [Propylenella binzhouense]|uniref:Riboflavin synthase n=1 Tax=Propylenella binzhouense TaxID=2555902 RepID=A0A964T1U9_9HYPH|nr:riboflavin synthase [Propylenella binzhouense]MYZ46704.1 riboflavin synthase [Propylenella binzhouense]